MCFPSAEKVRTYECCGTRCEHWSSRDFARLACFLITSAAFGILVGIASSNSHEDPRTTAILVAVLSIVYGLIICATVMVGHATNTFELTEVLEVPETLSNGTQRIVRFVNNEGDRVWPVDPATGENIGEKCPCCSEEVFEPPAIVTTCLDTQGAETKHFIHKGCYEEFQGRTAAGSLRKRHREEIRRTGRSTLTNQQKKLMNSFKDMCPACHYPVQCYVQLQRTPPPLSSRVSPLEAGDIETASFDTVVIE